MHYSLTWFDHNGTHTHPHSFAHVNQAISGAQDLLHLLGDTEREYIVHLHGKGPRLLNIYKVSADGIDPLPQLTEWLPLVVEGMDTIGDLEFQTSDGEYHHFTLVHDDNFIVFGGVCNVGLLQSGSFLKDRDFDLDANMQALTELLTNHYEGIEPDQSQNFYFNDRM